MTYIAGFCLIFFFYGLYLQGKEDWEFESTKEYEEEY